MMDSIKNKILYLEDIIKKVQQFKSRGMITVQSHGIFDIIHPGIIKHLDEAKSKGDILIVTVVKDKDVRKGPGRPVFPADYRLQNVASLQQVDYVCLVDDDIPFMCVKEINPDIFARGQAYAQLDLSIHNKVFKEENELYFGKCKVYETQGFSFSSSSIINNFLDIYPEAIKNYLKKFSLKYGFQDILKHINNIKNMKVLLIGDSIIDEYYYCSTMGKSTKSQLIVNKYLSHEVFAGGVLAIANHLAGICDIIHMVTLLGKDESKEDFILNNLKPNIETRFFYRDDGPTIVKRRYINQYQKQKIFEINYINDNYVEDVTTNNIIKYIESIVNNYDLILVSDFGHGLITEKMIKAIDCFPNKVAVNVQTNGANWGYNLITKYSRTDFICLDESEARLATQDRFANVEDVAKKLINCMKSKHLMITVGNKGSVCLSHDGDIIHVPAFSTKVVDVVGAGDAFFSYTAPCFAMNVPVEIASFVGNAVGALAVQIVGNKKPVEKHELFEFIHTLLK